MYKTTTLPTWDAPWSASEPFWMNPSLGRVSRLATTSNKNPLQKDLGLEVFQVNSLLPDQTPGTPPPSLHDGSSEDADHSARNITNSQPGPLAAENNNPHFYRRILSGYATLLVPFMFLYI